MRRISSSLAVSSTGRPATLKGLTGTLRERLLDVAGDGLIDARNRALLAVAYDTLLRRSELVALQVADIGWGAAEHWMRMQASYELALARREKVAAERRAGALHA